MKKKYNIPFLKYTLENCEQSKVNYEYAKTFDGDLVDCPEYVGDKFIEWRDNYEFEAELTVVSYGRGTSSATFELSDDDGHKYNCFMSSIFDIIRHKNFNAGKIKARWTFGKHGKNYGIFLAESEVTN